MNLEYMKKAILHYKKEDIWTYIKLSNDFFYKCKILDVFTHDFLILDVRGQVLNIDFTDVRSLREWRDKEEVDK